MSYKNIDYIGVKDINSIIHGMKLDMEYANQTIINKKKCNIVIKNIVPFIFNYIDFHLYNPNNNLILLPSVIKKYNNVINEFTFKYNI